MQLGVVGLHQSPRVVLTQELGHAGLTKRSASCVLVLDKPLKGGSTEDGKEFGELYEDVFGRVKSQQILYNVR